MTVRTRWWAMLLGVLLPLGLGWGQDDGVAEDVDPVALASRLIADGFWERAAQVLAAVEDPEAAELPVARFHMLVGLVRAHDGLHDQAIEAFRASLAQPDADPLVHLQLAQSLLSAARPLEAVAALDDAGQVAAALPSTWLLRARAELAASDPHAAWVALVQGEARFPDELAFPREQVFLLVRQGLFQEALGRGRQLLARQGDDARAWLVIAEALRNAGQEEQAILLLEEARLRFPLEVDVAGLLARVYLQQQRPAVASRILQVAAEIDGELFAAAAETARRAGQIERALYLNGRVPDAVEKAKQRLGLYVEAQDWGRALALEERLQRLGLLREDSLRYAMAYASFRIGDLDRADGFLEGIQDARVFRDATTLRQAMQDCRDAGGCL